MGAATGQGVTHLDIHIVAGLTICQITRYGPNPVLVGLAVVLGLGGAQGLRLIVFLAAGAV